MLPRRLATLALALASTALLSAPARAGIPVLVTVHGEVEFNAINQGVLAGVQDGEAVTMRFQVDSGVFVNNPSFPTRGYPIIPSSFRLIFESTTVTLPSPFPPGSTPYFVIRNNDPAVDGFLLSTNLSSPTGVPLSVNGGFGPFIDNFYVTYGGSTLPSLDVLDALGSYDFTGLTVFNWTVDDGPFNPLGMLFSDLSIEVLNGAWSDQGAALAGVDGDPRLLGSGSLAAGSLNNVALDHAAPSASAALFYGFGSTPVPFKGGTLMPFPFLGPIFVPTGGSGAVPLAFTMPPGVPGGTQLWVQWVIQDGAAVAGFALSNALRGDVP
jgi:hypothetical protein